MVPPVFVPFPRVVLAFSFKFSSPTSIFNIQRRHNSYFCVLFILAATLKAKHSQPFLVPRRVLRAQQRDMYSINKSPLES
jgi:hypothetical protein